MHLLKSSDIFPRHYLSITNPKIAISIYFWNSSIIHPFNVYRLSLKVIRQILLLYDTFIHGYHATMLKSFSVGHFRQKLAVKCYNTITAFDWEVVPDLWCHNWAHRSSGSVMPCVLNTPFLELNREKKTSSLWIRLKWSTYSSKVQFI